MASMENVCKVLNETFGYQSFRFQQKEIIQSVLDGKDTLAIMPTGGGKSLCYQLPALCSEGLAVVVSPLISLMQDQVMSLNQYGVEAGFLNSSLNSQEQFQVIEKLRKGKIKLLYVAPERILSGSTLTLLQSISLSLIAIDEAHCVSQWGHEFRKDYRRLHELKNHFPEVPVIALTATADERTRKDIVAQLGLNKPMEFVSTFNRPNIKYMILEKENEIKQLHQFIQENHPKDTGIVYCLSRKKVDQVTESLQKLGYKAVAYHAGLSAGARAKGQKRFDREEGLIVVATIAFGMGIDRPDVRYVAHLDLPKSIEGYYQETGRAGRDGLPANAWMVYGLSDVVKLSSMLELTEAEQSYKKVARHKLDMMLSLCETTRCRRQVLLEYFGESSPNECGNCDACLEPAELRDATIEAQKFLSAVYRTGQTFGASYIVEVLRGSRSEKVLQRKHDAISVHGIGSDISRNEWNRIIRQLLNLGYIQIKDWEYKNLSLTEKSRELLRSQAKFHIRKVIETATSITKSKKKAAIENTHGRDDLFEALRKLRKELAQEGGLPPYMIFSDKTLHDMCHLLPREKDDMLMVNGVGQNKFERFGEPFMQIIREHS